MTNITIEQEKSAAFTDADRWLIVEWLNDGKYRTLYRGTKRECEKKLPIINPAAIE